jgi:integrase
LDPLARSVARLRLPAAPGAAASGPGRPSDRRQTEPGKFPSRVGAQADASHVRRSFRKVVAAAGLNPDDWTPRELRHNFVSLLSDAGSPVEQISRLVGHSGTATTETVYRKQIRPVIVHGADVMDRIFPSRTEPDA